MIINKFAFTHKRIRFLCVWLENTTNLKLKTNLDGNFKKIEFRGELQYLILDWNQNMYSTLNYKLNTEEQAAVEELMIMLQWLETGEKYRLMNVRRKRRN